MQQQALERAFPQANNLAAESPGLHFSTTSMTVPLLQTLIDSEKVVAVRPLPSVC